MRSTKCQPILIVILLALASGCKEAGTERPTALQSSPAASQPSLDEEISAIASRLERLTALDTSKLSFQTPDNAVKSWWTLFDAAVEFENLTCRISDRAGRSWKSKAFSTSLTPEAVPRFTHRSECTTSSWRRTIDEVKIESETRAVVFATVWTNAVPNSSVSKSDVEEAKRGTRFRYVLEQLDGKWVIADAFRFSPKTSYSPEEWERVYEGKSFDHFFSTVYFQ
jgi:hypothetical protein